MSVDGGLLARLPSLEELDVGFSESLASLPDAFGGLRRLRVVWAGNGRLEGLPESLFACGALEEIHAPGNALKEISKGVGRLKRLRVLNVGRNQIGRLPDELAECARLQKLFVYENSLTRLPKGMEKVEALEELVCGFNPMPELPKEVRAKACAREAAKFLAGV